MNTVGFLKLESSNVNSELELIDANVLVVDTENISDYTTLRNTIHYIENLEIYNCLWLLNTDTDNTKRVDSLKEISKVSKKVYYLERESI